MSVKVCDAVDWQFDLCGINGEGAQELRKCISRYTKCHQNDAISKKVKQLFHRICNAVKSLVGQSDWQKAEKALTRHIYSFVPTPFRNFVVKKTHAQVHFLAGRMLGFCVWENEKQIRIPGVAKRLVENKLQTLRSQTSTLALKLFSQALSQGINLVLNAHAQRGGGNGRMGAAFSYPSPLVNQELAVLALRAALRHPLPPQVRQPIFLT